MSGATARGACTGLDRRARRSAEVLEEFWDVRLEALKREAERRRGRRVGRIREIGLERELQIAASPETVWEFLVDPEKRRAGRAGRRVVRPESGRRIPGGGDSGHIATGEFVELDPPRRLVWTWGWEPGSPSKVTPGSTTIEVELVPDGDGTLLKFAHIGLPDPEAAQMHGHGWDHYLERLEIAARGDDPGRDTWLDREM